MKLFSLTLLAALVGIGNGQSCSISCAEVDTCMFCESAYDNQDGTKTVTINVETCKYDSISWICCTGSDVSGGPDSISSANNYYGCQLTNPDDKNKDETVHPIISMIVPIAANAVYLTSHDGKWAGLPKPLGGEDYLFSNDICGGNPRNHGGQDCSDTNSAICKPEIDISSCTVSVTSPPTPTPVTSQPTSGDSVIDPPTWAWGDPHFRTWHGMKEFEFHGGCDLVLLKSAAFDMTIFVRTTIRYDYSYISEVAIRHKNDIFEVASWGDHILNDVATPELPAKMGDFTVTREVLNKKKTVFSIQMGPDVDSAITVVSFKDYVSIKVENATKAMFHDAVGLLGDFENGGMLARDGKTVLDDPNEFGFEWQVRPAEDGVLFNTAREPVWPTKCKLPDMSQPKPRRQLGEAAVTREQAEAACAGWRSEKSKCVDDVLKTGDLELAGGLVV